MKSKLFNFLLDPLLDIIVWLISEKDDHPKVPCPIRPPQTQRKPSAW
jgi:hypothetical protein